MNHITNYLSYDGISIFCMTSESTNIAILRNKDIDWILIQIFLFFLPFNEHDYNFADASKIDYSRSS